MIEQCFWEDVVTNVFELTVRFTDFDEIFPLLWSEKVLRSACKI